MPKISNTKYRPDIDGLRAVAVLGVMVFHFFPSKLKGGFVGVDIFFVISGFLITRIIAGALENDQFSFKHFYANRIKRIFPALITILVATLSFGWFILFQEELLQLGKHILASVFFVENFQLLTESGYFDTDSSLKPLLHLWSLAVEEQFYIFYPLILWAAWSFKKKLFSVVFWIAILSFLMNILLIHKYPSSGYYMLHTRTWELLSGGLLALFPSQFPPFIKTIEQQKKLSDTLSIIGIILIIISMFLIHKKYVFPGWWAVLPILGAVLIIFSGKDAFINRHVLGNRLFVGIGLISYPLYLWHWPIIAYIQILSSSQPTVAVRLIGFGGSIFLAYLTYALIEYPIRFKIKNFLRVPALIACMLALGFTGFFIQENVPFSNQSRGVQGLYASHETGVIDARDYTRYLTDGCGIADPTLAKEIGVCRHDTRKPVRFALIGDSKAHSLYPGVAAKSSENGYFIFFTGNMVQPVLYTPPKEPIITSAIIQSIINTVTQNKDIDVVVITTATRQLFRDLKQPETTMQYLPESTYYETALGNFDRVIRPFVQAGKKVVITVDNPTFPDIRQCSGRITSLSWINDFFQLSEQKPCQISYRTHLDYTQQYRKLLKEIEDTYSGQVRIFNILDQLCDMTQELCSSSLDGKALYSYSDHISDYASYRIAEKLIPFVENFANENN